MKIKAAMKILLPLVGLVLSTTALAEGREGIFGWHSYDDRISDVGTDNSLLMAELEAQLLITQAQGQLLSLELARLERAVETAQIIKFILPPGMTGPLQTWGSAPETPAQLPVE